VAAWLQWVGHAERIGGGGADPARPTLGLEMPSPSSPTVVLVHGAWHGAWCWERVIPLMEAEGVDVVAVDLPGHGDHPGPLTDVHGDATHVRAVLDGIDGPVVLCGHSYGGVVVTEAGTHPAVAHVVYLAALALDSTETVIGLFTERITAGEEVPGLAAAINMGEDGTSTVHPDAVGARLYNDCDAETIAWAAKRVDAQSMASFMQAPEAVAWRERPSTYVVCALDQGIPVPVQRDLAARCTNTVEWPTSHSPFASRPDLVASLLVAAVRNAAAGQ